MTSVRISERSLQKIIFLSFKILGSPLIRTVRKYFCNSFYCAMLFRKVDVTYPSTFPTWPLIHNNRFLISNHSMMNLNPYNAYRTLPGAIVSSLFIIQVGLSSRIFE